MHWATWKHHVKWETRIGRLARRVCDAMGLWVLGRGQSLLAWSCGRCSLCGWNPGLGEISGKGHRCMGQHGRHCSEIETVRDVSAHERAMRRFYANADRRKNRLERAS
jgi:hypothetical protein